MGELRVEAASTDGRRLTLDPIGEKGSVTLPVWEVESTIPAGFRQAWVDGDADESKVELCVGAGVGSKWGTFFYERKSDGAEVQVVFDASDLVKVLAVYAAAKLAERQT
jgi:hypothetical protein